MKTIIPTGLIIVLLSFLTSCSLSEGLEESQNTSASSYSSEGGNIRTEAASSSTDEKPLVEKRSRGGVSSQKSQTNEPRKGRQKTDSTTRAS